MDMPDLTPPLSRSRSSGLPKARPGGDIFPSRGEIILFPHLDSSPIMFVFFSKGR